MISLLAALTVSPALADSASTLTFSRLLARQDDGYSTTDGQLRRDALQLLEELGHEVQGAESRVFDTDRSGDARFTLGGEVDAMVCGEDREGFGCRTVVTWMLFDARQGELVYQAQVEGSYAAEGPPNREHIDGAFLASLEGLATRAEFKDLLSPEPQGWDDSLSLSACEASPSLPGEIGQALDAVLLVRNGGGTGSAVLISPDGYALTAAHVVKGADEVEVRSHAGKVYGARVLRVAESDDLALIKVQAEGLPCLPLADQDPVVGSALFAIGAPGGEELAFSVSSGVVSAVREIDGRRLVQTDSSINPGNSGGPLVGTDGRVTAVVSWKLAAPGFEGLGFGVPVTLAEERLGLVLNVSSEPLDAASTSNEWTSSESTSSPEGQLILSAER